MIASFYGHIEAVKMLIDKGADVNAEASDGMTAVRAAKKGRHRDVQAILKNAKRRQ